MDAQFDHERLNVYQAAVAFIEWLNPVFDALPKSLAARDQLDRASTSRRAFADSPDVLVLNDIRLEVEDETREAPCPAHRP